MSIPAISWCIEQKGLPPGEWVVLFHLCHCHNHETGRCDPSQEYLAEVTGMGSRTIRRHLKILEERGLIWRRSRGVHGGGRLSDFYILGHEPAKMAASRTGQTVHTNRPNGAKNVHELAGKQEVTGREQEDPPCIPPSEKMGEPRGDLFDGAKPELLSEQEPAPEPPPPEPERKPVKARLPESWVPSDEDRAYAHSLNLNDDDIEEIANDFHAYWTDRTDAGGRKSERGWRQTWRNRVRDVAPKFIRNRRMAFQASPGGYGRGSSIASVVARRRLEGEV